LIREKKPTGLGTLGPNSEREEVGHSESGRGRRGGVWRDTMPAIAMSFAGGRYRTAMLGGRGRARAQRRTAGMRSDTRMQAGGEGLAGAPAVAPSDYYDEGFLMDKLFDVDGRVRSVNSMHGRDIMEEAPVEAQEMMMVAHAAAPPMMAGEVSGGVAAMFGTVAVLAAAIFYRIASASTRVKSYEDARKILRTVKMDYLSDAEIAEGRAKRLESSRASGPSVVRPKNTPARPVRPNPRANEKLDPSVTKILQR